MSLKARFTLLFTLLFSILLGVLLSAIFVSFSQFRSDDFYIRLNEKEFFVFKGFINSKNSEELLKKIDQKVYQLQNETILILDNDNKILFTNNSKNDLLKESHLINKIKENKEIYLEIKDNDVIGKTHYFNKKNYIILISAFDKYGKRKLDYLKTTFLIAFIFGISLSLILSLYFAHRVLKPLAKLRFQMSNISENNLSKPIFIQDESIEIKSLAQSFNQMLERLNSAFSMQKNFVQHASHELRNPLAAMMSQTELALNSTLTVEEYNSLLKSLYEDQKFLSELTTQLLLLSKYESFTQNNEFSLVRIDDIINRCIDFCHNTFPNIIINLNFENIPEENYLEITGNETLLTSALNNLVKNACAYSIDNIVHISILATVKYISIKVVNNGKSIQANEIERLFMPFFRGKNSTYIKGFGIGLSISQRIAKIHNAIIRYETPTDNKNIFEFYFEKNENID